MCLKDQKLIRKLTVIQYIVKFAVLLSIFLFYFPLIFNAIDIENGFLALALKLESIKSFL